MRGHRVVTRLPAGKRTPPNGNICEVVQAPPERARPPCSTYRWALAVDLHAFAAKIVAP